MTTVTATSRAAPAGAPVQRVHYLLSRQAIDALPREQQNAFSYLVGLAQRGDFAAIAETKRWAGVGNPAGLPAGHEAIGPETLRKVAEAFARAGHPLSTEHVNAFKANRDLSGGSALGPTTAKALYDQVVSSAAPPPEDYRRVEFRGATVSVRTKTLLERAAPLAKVDPGALKVLREAMSPDEVQKLLVRNPDGFTSEYAAREYLAIRNRTAGNPWARG